MEALSSAETSLHCAFFELDLPSLQQLLRDRALTQDVRVVMDDGYLKDFNESFVRADRWGLMHNKFCVIDQKEVITGSTNPTENGVNKNDNNLVRIFSHLVVQNYEDEFQELWNGTFKGGEKVKSPRIHLSNSSLETYFCPEDQCAEHLKDELEKAQEHIFFLTFSFTHAGIADILLLKHLDGVPIEGVMEASQVSKYSQYQRLRHNQIAVRKDTNPSMMHHKVFIIDGKTVVTGSFNPTENGDKRNDENMLVIHDPLLAQHFQEEFHRIWETAVP